jgi:hypothetical protein
MGTGMARAIRPVGLAIGLLALAPAAHAALGTPVFEWARCQPAFCETGWYASPAVADIDGDGQVEVLGGGYRLLAVNGSTGAIEWAYPTGALRSGWPVDVFGGFEMRTLAVADLDGDGTAEILTARASGGSYDTWTVLEPNGATRDGWPRLDALDPGYAWGAYNQNLVVGEFVGDGDLEVGASSDVHYLAAFAADGAPLPANALYGAGKNWSQVGVHYDHAVDLRGYANCDPGTPPLEPRPNFADATPAIGDLDGDGTNEYVIVGSFYDCRTDNYDQLFQVPIVLRGDRTRWSKGTYDWTALPVPDANAAPLAIDYNVIESAEANPALADLDGDGVKEILYASYDGRVHAFWLDKTEHGSWPFDVNLDSNVKRFASEPAVADLDGDADGEVVFATWTEKGSNQRGDLFVVDSDGSEIARVALPSSGDDWDGAMAAPTVAQLDADVPLEVVVNTAHTGLVAYEIPGSVGGALRWPTGRGNLARTAPEPGSWGAGLVALAALAIRLRR